MTRGSALVDTLVGIFVAALLLQGAVAAAHLQAAGEQAQEAAAAASSWAARYGTPIDAADLARALAPDADTVQVDRLIDAFSVTVILRVPLTGPGGRVSKAVVGRATAPLSPYRSNHG
jgi:hypothetical protein